MSLKERIAARLKALFAGVALSKKSIEAITEQQSKGLTDESTDEDIDAKLNARNEIYSFDDQRKYDDYLAGKAKKDSDDKEAKRLADIAAGKKPDEPELPADTPEWAKAFMKTQKEETEALKQQLAAVQGEKVTNTRREQYVKTLEGTSDKFKSKALKDFDRMKFDTDDQFNEFLTEAETDAKDFVQFESSDEDGIIGAFKPMGGASRTKTGEKEVSPAMKELIAERTAKAEAKTAQTF